MTTTVTVRSFTGKAISLQVDPASKVSDVKDRIVEAMGRKSRPALACRGHELRDHQSLSHYDIAARDVYDIAARDVLHILPPSKVPKITLQFEKLDGQPFTLDVYSNATVAQLRKDIAVEEKIDVQRLNFVPSSEDPEDPDILIVSAPQDLPDEALISQYPLTGSTIFICRGPPSISAPSFNVQVRLHDDGRKLDVEAKFQMTLTEFKEAVRLQHNVSIADNVLILVGKEAAGDEIPIWDLGFVPNCTVHAVPFISLNVEIVWEKGFEPMLLHPLTRLSTIRKRLEEDDSVTRSLEKYWFTLDGKEHLKEWRNLWDLDVASGSTLYLRTCVISLVITTWGPTTTQVEAEEEETVWGLKERWALITGLPLDMTDRLSYRGKLLQDEKTLKEEGLVGGETLHCQGIQLDSETFFAGYTQ